MRATAYPGLAALMTVLFAVAPVAAQPQETPDIPAYRQIHGATDLAEKATLAEAFFAQTAPAFAESKFRNDVYLLLFQSYYGLKNWSKVIDTLDRLDKLTPQVTPDKRLAYMEQGFSISLNELKDSKRTLDFAQKLLALDPKHVHALLTMASAIPPNATEAELNKVTEYANRVLELPKPEGVPDAQWQSVRLGLQVQNQTIVASRIYTKKDYPACVKAYEDLIKLSPKDSDAHYRMGLCIYFQYASAYNAAILTNREYIDFVNECNKDSSCESDEKKPKVEAFQKTEDEQKGIYRDFRTKAIDAFAKVVAIGGAGPEVGASRTQLETLYKQSKGEGIQRKPEDPPTPDSTLLEGLDDLIAQKKKELGD
jgi:hypothetical protein